MDLHGEKKVASFGVVLGGFLMDCWHLVFHAQNVCPTTNQLPGGRLPVSHILVSSEDIGIVRTKTSALSAAKTSALSAAQTSALKTSASSPISMIKTTTCARLRRAHVVVGDIEM